MDHVAIMRKSWGLTQKILSGQKKIESRWCSLKCRPWNAVKKGDTVYFKDSGAPVCLKASVARVLQFADLTPGRVEELLHRYGEDDGLETEQIPLFFRRFRRKHYCILIFLAHSRKIKPFEIDKTGFGAMAAWITVDRISKIKK